MARFVAYYRVSAAGQRRSALGLDVQREAVARHVAGAGERIIAAFVKVEGGRKDDRPQLAAALAARCRHRGTRMVGKLDCLACNARFLLSVVEGTGEGGVMFCDLPTVPLGPAGKFTTTMAAAAELEAGLASQRTKDALKPAKDQGVKLGTPPWWPGARTRRGRQPRPSLPRRRRGRRTSGRWWRRYGPPASPPWPGSPWRWRPGACPPPAAGAPGAPATMLRLERTMEAAA